MREKKYATKKYMRQKNICEKNIYAGGGLRLMEERLPPATGISKVQTKRTYDINPLKSRDILDPFYLPIKKSVDILSILY